MDQATRVQSYNAKQLTASERKQLALEALSAKQPITQIAAGNGVSRQFIYKQKAKATEAVNDAFDTNHQSNEKVLFYLPVTWSWLCQLILCLVLRCRASHRGVKNLLLDVFDYDSSLGSIHNVIEQAKSKATSINNAQSLNAVKRAAQDEMFHHNAPILTGVDIDSLYCYLLSLERERDSDTWGIRLLDLKEQGLNPERVFGDDADAIEAACAYVFPDIPYHLDHYHIISDLKDMRRYFRNRLKSAVTHKNQLQAKVDSNLLNKQSQTYHADLEAAMRDEQHMRYLSKTIDILVDWMCHDVLDKPGITPAERQLLFDFVVAELDQLAKIHPHRIKAVVTTLKNQKPALLSFLDVLDEKFQAIADEHVFPIEKIWEMCELQRCKHGSDRYAIRSIPLQDYFGKEFDDIEDAVNHALNSTERTSSMVENLHSRIRPYLNLRQTIDNGYLELLRFYLNHVPFDNRAKVQRRNKTPAQLLTGQAHSHWLEMLGYQRFKQAA